MNDVVRNTLEGLCLGPIQSSGNLAVIPILNGDANGPEYLTLGAALAEKLIAITEVSQGGSVPEVRVVNKGDRPVLLLDGEELAGAKQNRVLNATILVASLSETIVDVSCTERGRWHHVSKEFNDSDVVMARGIRAGKNRAVLQSLKAGRSFQADQGAIWDSIDELADRESVSSPTGAMRDVFAAKRANLEELVSAFQRLDGQRGLIFVVDRAVAGMDLVSRPEAYAGLHSKLVRSYVIDSLPRQTGSRPPTQEAVDQFLERIQNAKETRFASVGLGIDFRYESGEVCGSALVHEDACVHAAFFSNAPYGAAPRMYGFRQRRRFRQE